MARNERSGGQFSLFIQGLPSSYDWKDLKDLVRQRAQHGIRGDVFDQTTSGHRRVRVGIAKVTSRNEAVDLYNWLISGLAEGRRHTVHLFDATDADARLMMSNCTASDCAGCARARTSRQGGVPTMSARPPRADMSQQRPAYSVTVPSTSLGMLSQNFQQMSLQSSAQGLVAPVTSNQSYPYMVAPTMQAISVPYATPRLPINVRDGYVRTEARGVFIQGLDFKAREEEIEALFSKSGQVRKCTLQTDSRGKSKGTARVEFATMAEAQLAIRTFSDSKWHGRFLKVRMDKEEVVVDDNAQSSRSSAPRSAAEQSRSGDQEPVIVNGSGRVLESS